MTDHKLFDVSITIHFLTLAADQNIGKEKGKHQEITIHLFSHHSSPKRMPFTTETSYSLFYTCFWKSL